MCRTSQFARCFLSAGFVCGMTLPTLVDTGTLDLFKGAVNRCLLPRVLLFFQFSVAQVLDPVGMRNQFLNNFIFLTWACAAVFNGNNDNNYNVE